MAIRIEQRPVPGQVLVDLSERLGPEAVDTPLRILADLDQPGFPQHPQVPRYPWAGNRQQFRQLAGCGRATMSLLLMPYPFARGIPSSDGHRAGSRRRL